MAKPLRIEWKHWVVAFGLAAAIICLFHVLQRVNGDRSGFGASKHLIKGSREQQLLKKGGPSGISRMAVTTQTVSNSKEDEWKQALEGKNIPVDFWGRVVDPDGNAVAGVKVKMSVRHWVVTAPFVPASYPIRKEVVSGIDGSFEWHGITGDCLEIESAEKTGYKASPQMRKTFSYGESAEPFVADRNKPFLLRMWRSIPKEATISNRALVGLVPDGRAYSLDLLKNVKLEGQNSSADICIRIVRPQHVTAHERYDWLVEIASIGGGVIQADDDFLFQAPTEDYTTHYKVEMVASKGDWTSILQKRFFFKSRNGTAYGAVKMVVYSDYNENCAVQIESIINTNSSRNLEP